MTVRRGLLHSSEHQSCAARSSLDLLSLGFPFSQDLMTGADGVSEPRRKLHRGKPLRCWGRRVFSHRPWDPAAAERPECEPPRTSVVVTVTEPCSPSSGLGPVSWERNRAGTCSLSVAVSHQSR
jgi:hypothetical protein